LTDVTAVAVGQGSGAPDFACAVVSDFIDGGASDGGIDAGRPGIVKCWGANESGELGNGTTAASATPVTVNGLVGVTGITVGIDEACALEDGIVQCWGDHVSAGDSDGNVAGTSATPVTVSSLAGAVSILDVSAGSYPCALFNSGLVQCDIVLEATVPPGNDNASPAGLTATAIAGGGRFSCALLTDSTVDCWGSSTLTEVLSNVPLGGKSAFPIAGLVGVSRMVTDGEYVCGLLSNGTVQCVADGLDEVASGNVSGDVTFVDIAGGDGFMCALAANGTVECWGLNVGNQLGNGTDSYTSPLGHVVASGS
jgi:alpha-tubulin suppressor-like RCC1 family protein